MDLWVIFLIAAAVFFIGEMSTLGFFLAPFGLGALVAMVSDLAGLPEAASIVAFFAVSGASFAGLRPVARGHLKTPPAIRTGTDALIGQTAIVLEGIDNDAGVGSVRIGGEVWTARAYDESQIAAGQKVHVIEIRGATALVAV